MIKRKKFSLGYLILIIIMFAITLTMLVPILNIFARSFTDPKMSSSMSGLRIIPKGFSLLNYEIIWKHPVLVPSIWNSIVITLIGTVINVLMTTSAAYALSRPNLPYKQAFMVFFIIMMLFDPGLVPEYLAVKDYGLMDSRWAVILVSSVNVYYMIICMRFFEEVPISMYEAATIDGAGHLRIYWNIFMPLARSGVATITMFYAVFRWNEYFRPGIYLLSPAKTTLQVILRQFVVESSTETIISAQSLLDYDKFARADIGALKAATIVTAILPILALYPLILRYMTTGIMTGAVKE